MSGLSRPVRLLCASQAVLSFGLGLAFPFFAIYLHRERGLSMGWVGGWLSLAVLATALSQGLGGELSDRVGRRSVMLLALWGRAATVLALAAAVAWGWPLPALIALHLSSSFVAHFFEPAARGWIADHTPARDRHRAYALMRTATHGGFAAGPALGGLLADRSYAALFVASAAVCALAAAGISSLRRDEEPPSEDGFDASGALKAAQDPRFLRLCLLNALLSVAMAQLVVPLSVYATRFLGLRDSQVGLLLSLNGALVVLLQLPAAHAMAGAPLSRALVLGSLCYAAGYAAVGWAGGFAALAVAVTVVTAGEILVPAAVHALAANMAPPTARGRYLGFLGLSRQLGASLGPVSGCWALDYASRHGKLAWEWGAVALVAAAAAAGFWLLGRSLKDSEQGMTGEDLRLEEERGDEVLVP